MLEVKSMEKITAYLGYKNIEPNKPLIITAKYPFNESVKVFIEDLSKPRYEPALVPYTDNPKMKEYTIDRFNELFEVLSIKYV